MPSRDSSRGSDRARSWCHHGRQLCGIETELSVPTERRPRTPHNLRSASHSRGIGAVGMAWWVWLIAAWVVVAVVFAVWLGSALRNSETRDWERRGRPDRRAAHR